MKTILVFKTESGEILQNDPECEGALVAAVRTDKKGKIIDQFVPKENWVDNSNEDSYSVARQKRQNPK